MNALTSLLGQLHVRALASIPLSLLAPIISFAFEMLACMFVFNSQSTINFVACSHYEYGLLNGGHTIT